ncbi:MAG TPA: glutamyl-tRNA reductase [Polyangiaceae bacterium]|nr:glutamyl-tRNA reductase [Polyangiaceae bacterium]
MIVCVGLSHRTAPVEVREQLAVRRDDVTRVIDAIRTGTPAAEVAILSTCNRVEVYAALPRGQKADAVKLDETARAIAAQLASHGGPAVGPALMRRHGSEALRHLFRVASSLDSLVLGEPQILGQLKEAVQIATEHGSVGPTLGRALHKALTVGKRVRTETQIGAGQVSVSSVAIELAGQIFGDLAGKSAVMVGAGEMAESAAKLLVKQGAKLIVVNRSPERARRLAAEVGGQPRDWGELNWCLLEADIVVTSTSSPTFVVTEAALKTARKARRGKSLFLIDIAVPRDVDPAVGSLDGVYLYDIDDLEQIVAESLAGRGAEAARAEKIVEAEVAAYDAKETELGMNPVIVGLRARVRATLLAELERSLGGKLKHLGEPERAALGAMLDAATNKLCHRPTSRLRALAADSRCGDYVEVVRDLFDLPERPDATDEAEDDREPRAAAQFALERRTEEKEPS